MNVVRWENSTCEDHSVNDARTGIRTQPAKKTSCYIAILRAYSLRVIIYNVISIHAYSKVYGYTIELVYCIDLAGADANYSACESRKSMFWNYAAT